MAAAAGVSGEAAAALYCDVASAAESGWGEAGFGDNEDDDLSGADPSLKVLLYSFTCHGRGSSAFALHLKASEGLLGSAALPLKAMQNP